MCLLGVVLYWKRFALEYPSRKAITNPYGENGSDKNRNLLPSDRVKLAIRRQVGYWPVDDWQHENGLLAATHLIDGLSMKDIQVICPKKCAVRYERCDLWFHGTSSPALQSNVLCNSCKYYSYLI